VVVPQAPRLTDKIVSAALEAIGVKEVTFSAPIQRDGPGWRACVELPLGTTVAMIVQKREEFASGLRRPLGCVWPELETDGHPGQLVLWVGDRDLSKRGKVKWSLLNKGQADYFEPMPFGVDQRGRPITLPLYQHNVLIGSLPGQGKTGAVRVLTCGAALDATAELWLHELKGSGDLDPLESVSHRFVSGIDDESIEYAAESLRLLREEVVRRTKALKDLPRDLCPDKRVTREIADKRSLRLHPLVCVIDECQNLFAHPDYGQQAGEDATFIIKIGRAFGVTLILATQRPDSKSLPTGVSGNVSIRFCLKVAGQKENDMVLGTSAYKNGLRATMFRAGVDAGIGYLVGAAADPIVCRTAYLDQLATEQVATRARALREAAGTLSGHALGEAPDRAPTFDLLDDLQTVYATAVWTDQAGVWSQVLCDRLAELRPEVYGGWKADQLGTVLAALDPPIETVQLNQTGPDGQRHNWRGVRRDDLTAAITARADRKGITP
jgi:S-DNA-T family DNA segregation ATPase FtsK/SpoIIIE